ncbi:hypothetical protein ACZ75_02050 [Massilia sp. NR 4-1]|nr:hypothetical protein ACZ75_02050 [Massilia sp. NR 4-1]
MWPERIRVGWFPGRCLLAGGEGAALELAGAMTPSALLAGLAGLPRRRPGAILDILLSDSAAELVHLPWQASVQRPDALRLYALAAFARQGMAVGEAHAIQTAYRHYGMDGIAYAVGRGWLEELAQGLQAQGLVLGSVVPLSIEAYWRGKRPATGRTLMLLQEDGRISLHAYQGRQLLMLDAEAVAGQPEQACRRLLRRAAMVDAAVQQFYYRPAGTLPDLGQTIAAGFAGAEVQRLPWDGGSGR